MNILIILTMVFAAIWASHTISHWRTKFDPRQLCKQEVAKERENFLSGVMAPPSVRSRTTESHSILFVIAYAAIAYVFSDGQWNLISDFWPYLLVPAFFIGQLWYWAITLPIFAQVFLGIVLVFSLPIWLYLAIFYAGASLFLLAVVALFDVFA